ncbi:MAG: Hpt domain-containing protein [Planctomycetota bacterium]
MSLGPAETIDANRSVQGRQDGLQVSAAPCAPSDSPGAGLPIHALLPLDDPELKQIVGEFIDKLATRLGGMQAALQAGDFELLAREAHWLKGSGGTVGFPHFTTPAANLEAAAKSNDRESAAKLLRELDSLRQRLVRPIVEQALATPLVTGDQPRPNKPSKATSIECVFPASDADFKRIADDFLARLDERLFGMLGLVQESAFEDLMNEGLWLNRAGEAAGFPAFGALAENLLRAAEREDLSACQQSLQEILQARQQVR